MNKILLEISGPDSAQALTDLISNVQYDKLDVEIVVVEITEVEPVQLSLPFEEK